MLIATLLMTIAASAAAPGAASAPLPPALRRAIEDYDHAQVKGDKAALQRLLAPDYLLVNSAGVTETKAEFIKDLTSPGYKLNPFVVERVVQRVWNGGAVNGGVARLTGVDGGKPFDACLRFSDIWSRRPRGWQVAYTHASRADPSHCTAKAR